MIVTEQEEFKLEVIETRSALWKKLERYLAERLEATRIKNDGDWGEVKTAHMRGKIAAYKEILELGAPETIRSRQEYAA